VVFARALSQLRPLMWYELYRAVSLVTSELAAIWKEEERRRRGKEWEDGEGKPLTIASMYSKSYGVVL
jgi:hypothetical protein